MDTWDCGIGEDELFCRKVGSEKQLLDELVESSLNGSPVSIELQLEDLASLPTADSPSSCSENIQVVPCMGAAAGSPERRTAPKILKKRSGPNAKKEISFKNLKKVTFEVEKMVAEEAYTGADRTDARARLALRLGAVPAPGPALNYKQLKEQRAEAKAAEPPLSSVLASGMNGIRKKKKGAIKKGKITKKGKN